MKFSWILGKKNLKSLSRQAKKFKVQSKYLSEQ